jgi:hypothetical protein
VLFRKRETEDVFDDTLQPHFGKPRKPSTQLSIEQCLRLDTHFPKAREILVCRVNDPFLIAQSVGDLTEATERYGVDEVVSRTGAVNLHEVGTG